MQVEGGRGHVSITFLFRAMAGRTLILPSQGFGRLCSAALLQHSAVELCQEDLHINLSRQAFEGFGGLGSFG